MHYGILEDDDGKLITDIKDKLKLRKEYTKQFDLNHITEIGILSPEVVYS